MSVYRDGKEPERLLKLPSANTWVRVEDVLYVSVIGAGEVVVRFKNGEQLTWTPKRDPEAMAAGFTKAINDWGRE